ncbi:MAG TPA: hypothetical protein VMT80_01745 [Candidatus Paceibacterota bacterium]|nr:hypothetical protein [Candidatus Paceibacterota bacterium]
MPYSRYIARAKFLLRQGALRDPASGWFALLTLAGIAFAGLIVWNLWAFDRLAQGKTIGAAAASTTPVFSQATLDQIHEVFEARAAEEAKYRSGEYRYADPSQ